MRPVPLPTPANAGVAVPAPGSGPGYWAGAPSAVLADGVTYLAYRLRRPTGAGRGYANVIARSVDGVDFSTLAVLGRQDFGAESLERPTLVRRPDGGWRLYVSSDVPATGGWRVEAIDAADPAAFDPTRRRRITLGGSGGTPLPSVKDPVVRYSAGGWEMWICAHPGTGEPETDRAVTGYAVSSDGLDWAWQGVALAGRPGRWDARMARVTAVLRSNGSLTAYYDGRATAGENYEERTGLATGAASDPAALRGRGDGPCAVSPYGPGGLRYLSVVPLPGGGHRLYYEVTRPDGAHDLCVEDVPAAR